MINGEYNIPKNKSFKCFNDIMLSKEQKESFVKCAERGDTRAMLVFDKRDKHFYELEIIRNVYSSQVILTKPEELEIPYGYTDRVEWYATTSDCAMWQDHNFYCL